MNKTILTKSPSTQQAIFFWEQMKPQETTGDQRGTASEPATKDQGKNQRPETKDQEWGNHDQELRTRELGPGTREQELRTREH